MENLATEAILGLIAAGVGAGFVNTIAGGGSLLTLPALMLVGLPADVANGTNRVGVLFQASSASFAFHGSGHMRGLPVGWIAAPTLLGAGCGALAAALTPADVLEPILIGSLIVMALLIAVRKSLLIPPDGAEFVHPKGHPWALLGLFGAGLYGGFIQAGLGFFLLAVFGGLLKLDLLRSNSIKAVTVVLLTVLALGIFLAHDLVLWVPGLIIGVSGMAGAFLGARFVVRTDPRILRIAVLVAVVAACVALLMRGH